MDAAILQLFADHERLRFAEIEKALGVRSNKLAYHLDKMVRDGRLEKDELDYKLTPQAERWLPLLTSSDVQIPIILVYAERDGSALLLRREKRPYKGLWGLPGGKLLHGETYADAAERILAKTGLAGTYQGVKHVMHERITEGSVTKNSFILITCAMDVEGTPNERCTWHTGEEPLIASDQWIIEHLDVPFSEAEYEEDKDELSVLP